MKGLVGVNVNANATITMTAIQYLELQAETQKWSMKIEQQRIIKLLESYALKKCDVHCSYSCECYGKYEAQRFIELIKGEQK